MSSRRPSRASLLSSTGSLRMPEPLAFETAQRVRSVSSGTPKRGTTSRLTGVSLLLPPVDSEAWANGNAKDHQNTIFLLKGRSTRQTCGSES
ncbi:hypothetical protein TNCV_3055421 [Trichonephila clavipes]|nr:hypothetical protein TNCV_3055421 [Trichonephila clavipes]